MKTDTTSRYASYEHGKDGRSNHVRLGDIEKRGFLVLKPYNGPPIPESEWLNLEYIDYKSGGDTNFAPIASAHGEMECKAPWDHGKPDKGCVWTENAKRCPTLVKWVEDIGARFGRVRIIKLNPSKSHQYVHHVMHQDHNNLLNPEGEGWIVRVWLQLTHDPKAYMILRPNKDSIFGESKIHLGKNSQFVVDSERLWHGAYHPGPDPRYALIASFESGPALQSWIDKNKA